MANPKEVIDRTLSPEAWAHFEAAMNALPPLIIALVKNIDDADETETMSLIEAFGEKWVEGSDLAENHPLRDLTNELSGRILKLALDEAIKWHLALNMARNLFSMIDEVIDDD